MWAVTLKILNPIKYKWNEMVVFKKYLHASCYKLQLQEG